MRKHFSLAIGKNLCVLQKEGCLACTESWRGQTPFFRAHKHHLKCLFFVRRFPIETGTGTSEHCCNELSGYLQLKNLRVVTLKEKKSGSEKAAVSYCHGTQSPGSTVLLVQWIEMVQCVCIQHDPTIASYARIFSAGCAHCCIWVIKNTHRLLELAPTAAQCNCYQHHSA